LGDDRFDSSLSLCGRLHSLPEEYKAILNASRGVSAKAWNVIQFISSSCEDVRSSLFFGAAPWSGGSLSVPYRAAMELVVVEA
jgi:hypothetical protein